MRVHRVSAMGDKIMNRTVGISVGGLILLVIIVAILF